MPSDKTNGDSSHTLSIAPTPRAIESQQYSEQIGIKESVLRFIGRFIRRETQRESLERLVMAQKDGEAALSTDERAFIGNVLKFRDQRAEDVMLPRADIVGVPLGSSLKETAQAFMESGYSRMPVYETTLDEVAGFIHVKDLTQGLMLDDETWKVDQACREILVVAPSMYISDLLVAMRTAKRHLAVVVDEYGGVDGLITIEDLMEEIVGDIEDEHDASEGSDIYARSGGEFLVRARTRVETLEEHIGSFLTSEEQEEVDTVGGLVSQMAGKLPTRGEVFIHSSGTRFEVLEAAPRKIISLLVKPASKQVNELN